jgi:hypothetical protein
MACGETSVGMEDSDIISDNLARWQGTIHLCAKFGKGNGNPEPNSDRRVLRLLENRDG